MTNCFFAHSRNGRIELTAVGVEDVDAACKQACAKVDEGDAELFIYRNPNKVKKLDIYHGKLEVLFEQTTSDVRENGVAFLACDGASGKGGEARDWMRLDAAKQFVLINVLTEICGSDVLHDLYFAILREKTAAADGSGSIVEKRRNVSGGEGFIPNVRAGVHLDTAHESAVLLCSALNRRVHSEDCSVSSRVVEGLAQGHAVEPVDGRERNGESFAGE